MEVIIAAEFSGNSANFLYTSELWTNGALHEANDSTWQRTERKTAAFERTATMVLLELEKSDGSTTAVQLPLLPATSLRAIFSSEAFQETSGTVEEWRTLTGSDFQAYCNLQGFNLRTDQHGSNGWSKPPARIGIIFNDQDDCDSPDSGRVVGGLFASAVAGYGTNNADSDASTDYWVRISVGALLLPPSPPSLPPYPPSMAPQPPPTAPPPPFPPYLYCSLTGADAGWCSGGANEEVWRDDGSQVGCTL